MVQRSTIPLLQEMKQFIRPKGETELFNLAQKLIAIDQVRKVKDAVMYKQPQREQKSLISIHAESYSEIQAKVSRLHEVDFNVTGNEINTMCANPDNIIMTGGNIFNYTKVDSSIGIETNTESPFIGNITTGSDAPFQFTSEEQNLFWENEHNCRLGNSKHQWSKLSKIFYEQSLKEEPTTRTVWHRDASKLRNYYFNHCDSDANPSKRNRVEERSSEVDVDNNISYASNSLESELSVRSPPKDMIIRVRQSGELNNEEYSFVIEEGKRIKESGGEVSGKRLLEAYYKRFPSYMRDKKDLSERWNKFFKGQRKENSLWFRSLKTHK